jgi:hypothetical protein
LHAGRSIDDQAKHGRLLESLADTLGDSAFSYS